MALPILHELAEAPQFHCANETPHFPLHFLTDTHSQLPVCSQQCRDLSQLLTECYLSYEVVLGNISGDGGSLLTELLVFVEELNCSDPDSFQLSRLPVNQNECTTLYCKY